MKALNTGPTVPFIGLSVRRFVNLYSISPHHQTSDDAQFCSSVREHRDRRDNYSVSPIKRRLQILQS